MNNIEEIRRRKVVNLRSHGRRRGGVCLRGEKKRDPLRKKDDEGFWLWCLCDHNHVQGIGRSIKLK